MSFVSADCVRPLDIIGACQKVISEYESQNGSLGAREPVRVIGDTGVLSIARDLLEFSGIHLERLPFAGRRIKATMHRYESCADISYASELNPCWTRFAICKELTHLLLGCDNNYTSDPKRLISSFANSSIPLFNDPAVDIEHLAIYGAMELLLPKQLGPTLYEMKDDERQNDAEIAHAFRLPVKIVTPRLYPRIRELFDCAYSEC